MATTPAFPADCRVFIDDVDCTYWLFGVDTITPDDINHRWRDIDISQFVKGAGLHTIKVTADSGVGRLDARVELS